ncbi:DUF2066 domain-containing protein [Colwellia sp. E2M01]|uniref:DUF2066 domain-containing protein n=1 Tax=Colwellia sp. E2M01 TaxID=2841561 RepID=UPI001C09A26B|nr:DUF2066 domain-containing protein [Colwellia sp. E2M01]MBU2871289.1 DUF2066 domain-containing protein [Colwellia sp. E2M01]
MFKFPFVLILLSLILTSIKSTALEVNDLYQVTVAVDSQSQDQRAQAITSALQGVFLKVGGKKSVLQNKVLLKAQSRANNYVNQYRYQRVDNQLSLVVNFNEQKVNALFKQAELALWGSLRPQVLLWLLDEQGASRSIVAYDTQALMPTAVNEFSKQRGLPIVMPLMDFDDSLQITVSDLWAYFPEQIKQASARYSADMVIVMRVSDSSLVNEKIKELAENQSNVNCGLLCQEQEVATPIALDWKVFTQGALYTQQYQGVDKVTLINQGLSDITKLIYQSYALSTNAENDFVIEVNNVKSLKSDTQLFDFLSNLSAIKAVTLISAQGDVRRFQIELLGSEEAFIASLKLNDKLILQTVPQVVPETVPQAIDDTESLLTESVIGEESDENVMTYRGMKVIVLGDTDEQTNLFDEIAEQNVEQSVEQDVIGGVDEDMTNNEDAINFQRELTTDNETNVDLTPAIDGAVDDTLDDLNNTTELDVEIDPETGEPLPVAEEKIPLTIVPNIPVFSWEQE